MRIPGRALLTACTFALAAALLVGCTPSHTDADPTKTPKPIPTPVFTSDADALAAATVVFKQFEATEDSVGRGGWNDPTPLRPYVSKAGYEHEAATAEKYRQQKARGVGSTRINNTKLESVRQKGDVVTVTMYVCEDLSSVDIVNADGKSLVSEDRADLVDYVTKLSGTSPKSLVIQSIDDWSGGGICKQ